MRPKWMLVLIAAVVLFAGCASDQDVADGGADPTTQPSGDAGGPKGDEGGKKKSGPGSQKKGSSGSKKGTTAARGGDSATEDGGGEDDGSAPFAPAAGTYIYDQTGYEEFCDASSCDKKDLPPTQDVDATYKDRSDDEIVVVTEAESSDSRFTKTTTRHTRTQALITNVQIRFNYQGFSFDNSYQPEPPVESLRYPIQEGASWSGAWKDSTSGTYSIVVGAKRAVTVGNATVQAFPVRTRTTFSGEFDGRADVITWIDPATAALVKIEGEIDVESVFGSYMSEFTATLRSGPGY